MQRGHTGSSSSTRRAKVADPHDVQSVSGPNQYSRQLRSGRRCRGPERQSCKPPASDAQSEDGRKGAGQGLVTDRVQTASARLEGRGRIVLRARWTRTRGRMLPVLSAITLSPDPALVASSKSPRPASGAGLASGTGLLFGLHRRLLRRCVHASRGLPRRRLLRPLDLV